MDKRKRKKKRHEFFFQCDTCGEYKVTKRIFYSTLLHEKDRTDLKERLAKDASAAKIIFKGGVCPKCKPKGSNAIFQVDVAVGKVAPLVKY